MIGEPLPHLAIPLGVRMETVGQVAEVGFAEQLSTVEMVQVVVSGRSSNGDDLFELASHPGQGEPSDGEIGSSACRCDLAVCQVGARHLL